MLLTTLVPSISPWNVWDLSWRLWLAYREYVDEVVRIRTKEANRRG